MESSNRISQLFIEGDNIVLIINDVKYVFKIVEISDKLAKASKEERLDYTISPSGYGIHWAKIDEDLSVHGLLNLKKPNVE